MRSMILSVSGKNGINFLIKTVLSPKYNILLASNVFDAMSQIRATRNISLVIIDIDHQPIESCDFINHLSTSSIYKLPVIVLHTHKKEFLEKNIEIPTFKSFQKPFDPIILLETVNASINKKVLDNSVFN